MDDFLTDDTTTNNIGASNPYENGSADIQVEENVVSNDGNYGDVFTDVEVPQEKKQSEDQEPTNTRLNFGKKKMYFLNSVWLESHRQMLQEKAKKEREEQDQLQQQAKEDIQKFHDDRKRRIQEAKKQNKTKETQLREDLQAVFEHGTVWEQVAKMVNLQEPTDKSGLSGDQERMRKLLIQLKNDKKT
ncbi:hypothetical protein RFI_10417 [Reticulomyxa filosa]|uniref:Clathrin light chain n=1 Tax=Reticulomyxa filosa TaxID=46433 RepID=X6NL44_RETFI|nr:hypothetical protein RFI_10417 [Reticulomyxa filosa]|eukprot:ETO26716.1 hypothetical protein RFI_10417 [Reticulomyxa filosa]